jgi:hypothetical protein
MCVLFWWHSAHQAHVPYPARSRWNDYVFVANDPRSLAALDKHVEAPADKVALPLVVLGEPGACVHGLNRIGGWVD